MKTLDTSIRFRCQKALVSRLKTIAATKRSKYQREAREALEKFVEDWDAKAAKRTAKKAA